MHQQSEKQNKIRNIIDQAGRELEAEGIKYFIGAIDRQPKAADGGKAYAQSDLTGEDFFHILDMALTTRQDLINLGIWTGQLIQSRTKTKK